MTNIPEMAGGTDAPRLVSDEELLAHLRRVNSRLIRALESLGNGQSDAVDDVASHLRTLIGHGRGDDLIRRVIKAHNFTWPSLFVSPSPHRDRGVRLSIGNVPGKCASADTKGEWKRLDRWASQLVLVIDHGQGQRTSTWEKLIETYANTYGAHASHTVPRLLDATSRLYSDRLNLGEYLIHCGGSGVADAVNQILHEANGKPVVTGQLLTEHHFRLLGLTLRGPDGQGMDILINPSNPTEKTDIIKLHMADDHWERITVEPDEESGPSGLMTIEVQQLKPDWWPS